MSEWRKWGTDRRIEFEKEITASRLERELRYYQEELGGEFGVRELLMLKDTEAKIRIAEAINDLPEFLMDQIGLEENHGEYLTVGRAIEQLVQLLDERLGGEDG